MQHLIVHRLHAGPTANMAVPRDCTGFSTKPRRFYFPGFRSISRRSSTFSLSRGIVAMISRAASGSKISERSVLRKLRQLIVRLQGHGHGITLLGEISHEPQF